MRKQAKVEILMSTYNGEAYLREQLDSILAQEGDFYMKVSIRDDGSTDGTRDILAEYATNSHVQVTYGENVGINASMMELVLSSARDYDYFAFSDQDDYWYSGRIQKAVKALERLPTSTPLLWSCSEELTNENLIPYDSMFRPKLLGNVYNAILQNKIPGHTQVFNAALRNIYEIFPANKMHVYDWVLYLLACEFGQIYFCDDICGQYRMHTHNVIGYDSGWFVLILRRIKNLRAGEFTNTVKQLKCYVDLYEDKLNGEHKAEIKQFLSMRRNIFTRIKYIFQMKLKLDNSMESLQFRIVYLCGAFGK